MRNLVAALRSQPLSLLAALASAALAPLAGCTRGPTIITQARPNPFAGHRGYTLAPVETGDLHVGDLPAQIWLAGRSAEQQESFHVDVGAMSARFAESAIERCGASRGVTVAEPGSAGGGFVIRPSLTRIDTDQWSTPDHRLTVRIFDGRGQQLDVLIFHATGAGFGGYALGTRMRYAGTNFGEQLCDYLRERSGG